jgi:hypothetical protein
MRKNKNNLTGKDLLLVFLISWFASDCYIYAKRLFDCSWIKIGSYDVCALKINKTNLNE